MNNFERALCQKHPHQVLSHLTKWFRRRSHLNEKVYGRAETDGRTDDGHHGITIAHLAIKTVKIIQKPSAILFFKINA